MNAYFFNMTPEEKENILDKHKELYNGYQSLQPVGNNTKPLYTQDYANDKHGITLSNKNVVKRYTNMNINESDVNKSETCEQCGANGVMMESETCEQCGYKSETSENFTGKFDYVEVKDLGDENNDMQSDSYDELDEQGGGITPDMNIGDVDSAFDFKSMGPIDAYDDNDKNYFSDELNIFDDDDLQAARAFADYDDDDAEGFSTEDILMSLRNDIDPLGTDTSIDMDLSRVKNPFDFESGGPMRQSSGFRESTENLVRDDLKESFIKQKDRINEMFEKFKKYN